jgi:hypothetical protein
LVPQKSEDGGMSDYDTDILTWSEHQADLLRRVAAGQPVNESPDWPNIIEEVGDVGLNSLRACRSLLVQALVHMLKAEAWPLSREVPHWTAEARRFRGDAADAFTPSMRQRIDVADLYRRALRAMPDTIDGQPPLPVADICPLTLDDLLVDD